MVDVIGAGLSGLSAASFLSNAGVKVNIFEQAKDIGLGRGQDFQVIRNYGIDKGFLDSLGQYNIKIKHKHFVNKIVKYAPSGKAMEMVSDNGPLFYVIKRGNSEDSIENQIFESINHKNVNFNFEHPATVSSGDIIAAGPILRNVMGFGYTFRGINVDPDKILLFMDNNYAPQGYIYVTPYGNKSASIAIFSYDLTQNLRILLDNFLEENKIVKQIISGYRAKEVFSGYALCNYPKSAQIGNKLFTGAAAGFVEAARGFGIKYSILSGILAAKSIIENKNYDDLWKAEFGQDLLENLKRHFVLSSLSNEGYEKLILKNKVKPSNYVKLPDSMNDFLKEIMIKNELKRYQEQYSLEKLFKK